MSAHGFIAWTGYLQGCCEGDGPEISELLLQVLFCPPGRSRGERKCFRGLNESGGTHYWLNVNRFYFLGKVKKDGRRK